MDSSHRHVPAITPEQQKLIEQLCAISSSGMDAFTTYQYLIRARKK